MCTACQRPRRRRAVRSELIRPPLPLAFRGQRSVLVVRARSAQEYGYPQPSSAAQEDAAREQRVYPAQHFHHPWGARMIAGREKTVTEVAAGYIEPTVAYQTREIAERLRELVEVQRVVDERNARLEAGRAAARAGHDERVLNATLAVEMERTRTARERRLQAIGRMEDAFQARTENE